MIPSNQQPRCGAAHTEEHLFGLLRTRLSRGIVLLGAVSMLAACGANTPGVGQGATAIVPTTELPTLETTPSVMLEPTTAATGTIGTDTTTTPDSGTTTTPDSGTTTTPDTGTTTTPDSGTTTTPDTGTTTTPDSGTTTTPDTGTTTTPDTGTTTTPDTDTTTTPGTDTTTTPDTDTTTTPASGDASAVEISFADLMENPDEYLDQQVMVESTVQQIYNPIGIQLSDETTPSTSSTMVLIVVGEEQLFTDMADWLNEPVETMGTLREFNEAEFEREYSWFDADAAWVTQIEEGQPVLVADMIEPRS
jgi:hypothetical protein